ncbi:N-6 DNA methylase [Geobacter sp.]|uniref:N-6 DNA methylase n=1 Tax=Geobacter sp. TaxID=46610 RepID=UPI0026177BD9|nr:N-6 DNA methylase [Geobacter sp.]
MPGNWTTCRTCSSPTETKSSSGTTAPRLSVARARLAKRPYTRTFAGDWTLKNPLNAPREGEKTIPRERFRWSVWAQGVSGENLVRFVRDEVFPFFAEAAQRSAVNFMEGARLGIDDPTVLTQVVGLVDGLRLDRADADTKGDLFEHVLRQISQAGELGQFRTPRHIIRAMVRMIDPRIGETVYDPAAGTAGFLVAAYDHIRLENSSPGAVDEVELDGKPLRRGAGDMLSAAKWDILAHRTFYGSDVDPKMVRLATMNLTLRGLPAVSIRRRNVLTTTLDPQQKADLGIPPEGYAVILANPPFSGRVDRDRIVDDVKIGTTTATEILFLKYMMGKLATGTSDSMRNISQGKLKCLPIPVPPLEIQEAFSTRAVDIGALIIQQERSLGQAEALMHSLMARYFGETGTGDAAPCDTKAPSPLPLSPRKGGAKEKPLPAGEGEHDLPLVAEPPVPYAADTVPRRILSHMFPGRDYSRAEIAAALSLSDTEWAWAIRQLKEEGAVVQTGERRGARYSLKAID